MEAELKLCDFWANSAPTHTCTSKAPQKSVWFKIVHVVDNISVTFTIGKTLD